MRKRIYINLAAGMILLFLVSQLTAQDEQWLQYHSSREAGQILGEVGSQAMQLSSEPPDGVKLPQFKGQTQLFAKWPTPMVKSGRLWIALDRTHKQGPYDLLYIDSNGNGGLDDETPAAAYRMDQRRAYFGPVKVIFEVEDGPVTYHLNFSSYQYTDTRLNASTGGWYEGDITVGATKKHCVLIDQNANGTFNDKSFDSSNGDRIRIGPKGSRDTRFVGNLIEVDGTLYRPEIAPDGAFIRLAVAEDVKFGNVRLAESITQFSANGENGLFVLKPDKGIVSLPVGRYRVYDWAIERKDEKDILWKLQGTRLREEIAFDISEGMEAEIPIGEPIVAILNASGRDGTHSFRHDIKGRAGENIILTRNGARPQAPKVRISSADGTYDRTFSFQYG